MVCSTGHFAIFADNASLISQIDDIDLLITVINKDGISSTSLILKHFSLLVKI